jgi:hypothetical protein
VSRVKKSYGKKSASLPQNFLFRVIARRKPGMISEEAAEANVQLFTSNEGISRAETP